MKKLKYYNFIQKPDKASFIVYADFDCIIEKIGGSINIPENSSTTKVREPIP